MFVTAVREKGRQENILEVSKAIYLDIFLKEMSLYLEVTKCCI